MTSAMTLVVAIAYILIAVIAICISSPGLIKQLRKILNPVFRRQSASAGIPNPADVSEMAQVGAFGVAYTHLNPGGKAYFGPALLEVVAEDPPVEAGSTVSIIARDGERVVVRAE